MNSAADTLVLPGSFCWSTLCEVAPALISSLCEEPWIHVSSSIVTDQRVKYQIQAFLRKPTVPSTYVKGNFVSFKATQDVQHKKLHQGKIWHNCQQFVVPVGARNTAGVNFGTEFSLLQVTWAVHELKHASYTGWVKRHGAPVCLLWKGFHIETISTVKLGIKQQNWPQLLGFTDYCLKLTANISRNHSWLQLQNSIWKGILKCYWTFAVDCNLFAVDCIPLDAGPIWKQLAVSIKKMLQLPLLCMGVQASIIPQAFSWLNRCEAFVRRKEPISPVSIDRFTKVEWQCKGFSWVYYNLPNL